MNYNPGGDISRRRRYQRPPATIGQSGFKEYASKVLASQANQPGFPNAYRLLGRADAPVNATPEQVSINTVNDYPVQTIRQGKTLVSFQAMVPDVPFDKKGHEDNQTMLNMWGFGAMMMGLLFIGREVEGF